ncbi:hypothetical protein Pan216_54460 [Planctomycetes bacterium Pan216]|uniref:FG-GAP repeat protein n=1 Tax=Kolteria novifilia TaxID=2527975 RepID=A0A518BC54_9BACT|nr:hypothetical protein Pan216_54460 [Planctomycetes bacterium Pan216]
MPLSLLASRAAGPLSSLKKFFGDVTRKSEVASNSFGRAMAEVEALNDRIVPANFSVNGAILNVTLEANESVTLSTIGVGDSADGGVLTLDGTLWSGTDDPGVAVGQGQVDLGFDNQDGAVFTTVKINGLGNNTVNIDETDTVFNEALSITLTNGNSIVNTGDFAFGGAGDTLKITATGVDVTQGPDGVLTLADAATFDLGATGDLLLDSEENEFANSPIAITQANDVTIVSKEDTLDAAVSIDGKVVGDLEVFIEGDAVADELLVGRSTGISVGGTTLLSSKAMTVFGSIEAEGAFTGAVSVFHGGTTLAGDVLITTTGNTSLLIDEIDIEAELVEPLLVLNATSISQTPGGSINVGEGMGKTAVSSSTGAGDIVLANASNKFGPVLLDSQANSVSLATMESLLFDSDANLIITDLSLTAEMDVDANDSKLTVLGLTSVTAGEDVLIDNADNDLNNVKVIQSGDDADEAEVKVFDKNTVTFWGSIAGELEVISTNILTLGKIAPLTLTGGKDSVFTSGTISVEDFAVDLGTGMSTFDATVNSPISINSPNSQGILFVGDTGEVEILDGVKVGAGSVLAGDGKFEVGAAGVDVQPMGLVAAANVSPFGLITPGSLDITGDLNFSAGGIFGQEITGTDPGEFDTIAVDGTADITDATLAIATEGYTATVGDSFVILTADVVTGTFGNLDDMDQLTVDGVTYMVTTTATDVTLEVVAVGPTVQADGIGLYRPSAAEFVFNTSDVFNFDPNAFFTIGFGIVGDQGFIGDFTGDGIVNVAVYRDVSDTEPGFFIINTSPINAFDSSAFITTPFIGNGDEVPFAGDWDGDGDDDLGLYRNADATYVTINLPEIAPGQTGEVALGLTRNIVFGNPSSPTNPTDPPAVGNFNAAYAADQIGFGAQGTLDMADVDIATLPAGNSSISAFFQPSPLVFGTTGDTQLNGNYTGEVDGLDQRGLYRSESATFSISSGSQPNIVFGLVGDQGLTGNFVGLLLPVVPTTESLVDSFFEEV